MRIFPPPAPTKNLSRLLETLAVLCWRLKCNSGEGETQEVANYGIPHGLEEKWQGLRHGSKRLLKRRNQCSAGEPQFQIRKGGQ